MRLEFIRELFDHKNWIFFIIKRKVQVDYNTISQKAYYFAINLSRLRNII